MHDLAQTIDHHGFAIIPDVIDEQEIELLSHHLNRLADDRTINRRNTAYGVRDLLNVAPITRELAENERLRAIIDRILGPEARIVRAIYFDKTPEANWKVAWHQDLTITLRRRVEVEGYGPWSVKAGIIHVQPPVQILEKMLALRIHLDDADETNGALRVISGSHRAGRLSALEISNWRANQQPSYCSVRRGGVMAMRPLLLHASSAATSPSHRRVIHFEYCVAPLPKGLEWHES